MKVEYTLWGILYLFWGVYGIPAGLLYDFNVKEAVYLPKEDDVSSDEVKLEVPIVFFGVAFESVFVNSNGFLSFQTEIPQFINIEFPLDYPIIAPFYSNVDTRNAGTVSYYETSSPGLLQRATENVQTSFSNVIDFQATSLLIVTWHGVGYYREKADKINTYQVVISTDGASTFVEFLYPENGIQWIQGTGDESGLPDARAQAGIISPEGAVFTLPGSGTEQVKNLDKWSNMNLNGQFIYKVDGQIIVEPDLNNDSIKSSDKPIMCSEAPTACHVQAKCRDYESGFCCECKPKYYGNGKFCVKKDVPLRVNGKVNGKINGERLENLDLQSYIVMADGRAYTAISKIPESIGFDIQSLQVLGGVIGYLFAKPIRDSMNGYQLTGGVFNHTTTINFLNTSQQIYIKQKYLGLDVFDQLRLEADIQGEIPTIPAESKVNIDEYQEQYTMTNPGVIQMTSSRTFKYNNINNEEVVHHYTVDQTYLFDYCKFENKSVGETWKLRVGKNFISYESREQIIRYGLSNKISPLGDADPCDEGRSQCGENSACVVENDSFRCVCNPGYQHFFTGTETICADLNECLTGLHDCDYNAECINVVGSYACKCNPGFEGNGQYCENARSCQNIKCTENANCVEDNNIANCRCLPGFTGNGQNCTPVIDHSCHVTNNCSPYGVCSINPETNVYYCTCLPGYNGDGYTCEEVQTATDSDVTEQTSQNIIQRCLLGVCWCPKGYKIEKGTTYCILPDEDETTEITTATAGTESSVIDSPEVQCFNSTLCFCPKGFIHSKIKNQCMIKEDSKFTTKGLSHIKSCNVLDNCHRDAHCLYSSTIDSYDCTCNNGFEGDGINTCIAEQVSCRILDNCDAHASCTYDEVLGKSKCFCNEGYDGDGYSCKISAICTGNEDCSLTEECLYTNSQRYECVCKEGYIRDSQNQCVPPSSGSCGGGTCVEHAECHYDDEIETYYCTCQSGYIGDGITSCTPKPVGCDTLNNCGENAHCVYDVPSTIYQCKCLEGYQGDGFICYTEKDCNIDPNMCDYRAGCVTTSERKYVCKCRDGYIGNGTICKETPRHDGNFLLLNQGMATLRVPMEPTQRNPGKPIQIRFHQTAVGLDIDCFEGRMYWSDINERAIRSSSFNGSNKSDFINEAIGSPEGLAVDWVSRNIYWTDSTNDTIEVANLETKRRRTLFSTDLVNPRGIAVHPQRGKIFWTDWNRKNPRIEWANADGTGRQTFLKGEPKSLPNSLAIDYDEEKLYYADAGTKTIECIQIDSKVRQTIAINCTYPFGIAVTDKHIYWSDWISKKIERVEKYSLKRLPPLPVPLGGSGSKLFGLAAVPISCPVLTNVCQYNKCQDEHICLPNGSGSRTCACAYRSDAPNEKTTCQL